MRSWYPLGAIVTGLLICQILATLIVYQSNLDLFAKIKAVEAAGYVAIPNALARPGLLNWTTAFKGGSFFMFTIGIGVTVWSICLAWGYDRLFGRRRLFLIPLILAWLFIVYLGNINGVSLLFTSYFLIVPPLVFGMALKTLPDRNRRNPWVIRFAFLLPLVVIGMVWGSQIRSDLFLDVRDYIFWSNPIGQSLSDYYYDNTRSPVEAFISLRQKTIRTVHLNQVADESLRDRLRTVLLGYDFIPVSPEVHADLDVFVNGPDFSFRVGDRPVLIPTVDQFFNEPDRVLGQFSYSVDRNRQFRKVTSWALVAGLPLGLYFIVFAFLQGTFRLFFAPGTAAIYAGLFCFVIGVGLLGPVIYGRSIDDSDLPGLLASDSYWKKTAALKKVYADGLDLGDFDYKPLMNSPQAAVRYWLAANLGNSKSPDANKDLQRLLQDKQVNIVCMAVRSLGQHSEQGARRLVGDVMMHHSHWYVQWYAYRALRSLGWVQGESI